MNAQTINFPDTNLKLRLLSSADGNGVAYHNGLSFKIDTNNDNEIQVNEALLVNHLILNNCNISDLSGLEYFINLKQLNCANNSISTLHLTTFTNLVGFDAYNNNLTTLTVIDLPLLTNFSCFDNQLTSINLQNLPNLHTIRCQNNYLTTLSINSLPNLTTLQCNNNLLTTLNTTELSTIKNINCASNNLNSLYIKNASNEAMQLNFSNNVNLEYICADDFELTKVQSLITEYGYANCHVNSYCSFISGGDFYTINGTVRYDELNDGCDGLDILYPNLKISLSDGTNSGNVNANALGNYTISVQDGAHSMQPLLENPNYFTISPALTTVTFPTQGNTFQQNFCLSPNGLHPDLHIKLSQVDFDYSALPGSFNTYKIIYRNNGTNTQSGTVNFTFNDAILEYDNAIPISSSQSLNNLSWNFSNLKPFESREILVTFYLNSNTEFPSVNEGDAVNFTATVLTDLQDETPNDNIVILNQLASDYVLLNTPAKTFENYFVLYPNPSENILNVASKNGVVKESISIYNNRAQLVQTVKTPKEISEIDVTKLLTGTYIIVIKTIDGIYKSKFIKK